VTHTAQVLAKLKQLNAGEIAAATTANFARLFGLKSELGVAP
jgi:Tat protein secretion system quality control protein TatD with DNase activity